MTLKNGRRRFLAALSTVTVVTSLPRLSFAQDSSIPDCLSGTIKNEGWVADWSARGVVVSPIIDVALEREKHPELISSNYFDIKLRNSVELSSVFTLVINNIPTSFQFGNKKYIRSKNEFYDKQGRPMAYEGMAFNSDKASIVSSLSFLLSKEGMDDFYVVVDHGAPLDSGLTFVADASLTRKILENETKPLFVTLKLNDIAILQNRINFQGVSSLSKQAVEMSREQIERSEIGQCEGGCFITTAVCSSIGLSDDCWELKKLRFFRDHHLMATKSGEFEVKEYYRTAPSIVASINNQSNKNIIYRSIYWKYILPCAVAIKFGGYDWAHKRYKCMLEYLKKRTDVMTDIYTA